MEIVDNGDEVNHLGTKSFTRLLEVKTYRKEKGRKKKLPAKFGLLFLTLLFLYLDFLEARHHISFISVPDIVSDTP